MATAQLPASSPSSPSLVAQPGRLALQVFFFRTVASRPEAAKSAAVFMLNTSLGLQYPVDALPAASDVASGALEGFGDIEFKKSKGESCCACDSVNAGLVQGGALSRWIWSSARWCILFHERERGA